MIYPFIFLLGAAFGWFKASKRGGQTLDKLQYSAVFGILFMIITLFIGVFAGLLGF